MVRVLRGRRVWVIVGLLVCYTVFFMLGGCADQLILFPSTERIDVRGTTRRVVPFEGGELEVWTGRANTPAGREPEAFILTFGGNADRAEYHAVDVAGWGRFPVEVWAVNPPGYGRSTPPAKLSRLEGAALAAYDELAKVADGRPIFVRGTSLGTTMALRVASQRPVAGLVLRTPPPLRQLILERHGWWNLWLLAMPVAMGVPSDLDALANARACKVPAVFLLMDADTLVPYRYQQRVVDAYAGPKRVVVSRGQHNSAVSTDAARALAVAIDWLWQSVSRK